MLGVLFAVLAASCWGFTAIFIRLGLQYMRPTTGTWVALLPGFVIVLTLAFIFNSDDILSLGYKAFLWFALAGFFNFALGRFLNAFSTSLVGVTKATPLFNTAPLFATIFAVIFLGESITFWVVIGTGTIITGVVLITSEQI